MNVKNLSDSVSNSHEALTSDGPTSYSSNVIITFFIVIFFIFSFTGNLLIVATIKSNSQLYKITNLFIASLCVSDLISTVLCSPLWLYRNTWGYSDWRWSKHLCKFYWVSDFTTNYVTILLIASFAAFRFAVVRKPFKVWDIPKTRVIFYITTLWSFSLIIALPLAIFIDVRDTNKNKNWLPSCSIVDDKDCCLQQINTYNLVVDPLMFFLSISFIIVCCILLTRRLIKLKRKIFEFRENKMLDLTIFPINYKKGNAPNVTEDMMTGISRTLENRRRHTSSLRNKDKAKREKTFKLQKQKSLQLGLVVFSFLLGYLPTAAYLIWSITTSRNRIFEYWFGIVSYFCLRSSECINPFMYILGSNKLRLETRKILQRLKESLNL